MDSTFVLLKAAIMIGTSTKTDDKRQNDSSNEVRKLKPKIYTDIDYRNRPKNNNDDYKKYDISTSWLYVIVRKRGVSSSNFEINDK